MIIKSSNFIKSSSKTIDCPQNNIPEFAFIGRSNVGKSSLLNMLLDRKGIAKVSKTPGKTKLINYFLVNDNIFFVDLPGYGYAKLSKKNKLEISKITQSYFENRLQLKQIFLLIDIRHEIQKADNEFMKYLQSIKKEFNIIFTKKDKIKESQVNKYCLDYLRSLQNIFVNNEYFICSSKTKFGRQEMLDYISKVKF